MTGSTPTPDTVGVPPSGGTAKAPALSAFKRDCLYAIGALQQHDLEYSLPHGLAIKAVLEKKYEEAVNHGRLYPNLDALVEDGYLEKHKTDRRTNGYMLTEQGEQYLHDRACEVVASVPGLNIEGGDN